MDTWYLLGWLNRLKATADDGDEGYNGNVRYYLNKAKEVHKANPTDDADMVSEARYSKYYVVYCWSSK